MPRGQPGVPVRNPEARLLSDYLARYYPTTRVQLQARIGGVNPQDPAGNYSSAELRALGVWRRYVDAVLFLPEKVILLEASLKTDPGKISILDLYAHLFPQTPEFAEFKGLPIQKTALWAMHDQASELIARQHNVTVVIFAPDWLQGFLDTLDTRHQRAPLTELSVVSS